MELGFDEVMQEEKEKYLEIAHSVKLDYIALPVKNKKQI
jgi:hypothetical protein